MDTARIPSFGSTYKCNVSAITVSFYKEILGLRKMRFVSLADKWPHGVQVEV